MMNLNGVYLLTMGLLYATLLLTVDALDRFSTNGNENRQNQTQSTSETVRPEVQQPEEQERPIQDDKRYINNVFHRWMLKGVKPPQLKTIAHVNHKDVDSPDKEDEDSPSETTGKRDDLLVGYKTLCCIQVLSTPICCHQTRASSIRHELIMKRNMFLRKRRVVAL